MCGLFLVVLAFVVSDAASGATGVTSASASAFVDSKGLHFVSRDAFCAYHCSHLHVTRAYRHLRAQSECLATICGSYFAPRANQVVASPPSSPSARRQLRPSLVFSGDRTSRSLADDDAVVGDVHAATEDGKNVTIISVISCASVTDITLSIGDPEQDEFAGFYQAFATAYDAMLAGKDATFDACQLQFLQKELLTTYATADLMDDADEMEIKPSLLKLKAAGDELLCLKQIKRIWPATSESHTPFLTRSDQDNAMATVVLVHVSAAVGDEILALPCVESVTVLPPILKLMPFAKSSYALSRDTAKSKEGPALEIRLAKGVHTQRARTRLAARVTQATGIQNLITMQGSTPATGGVLLQTALDDYTTWTQVLALVLDDEAVEWVDLQQVVTTSSLQALKAPTLEQRLLREGFLEAAGRMAMTEHEHPMSRRLDDYVQDLMGVKMMQEHNITGSSIVVGVTDTGLYIDHDQFDQESRKMYDKEDLTARKVVYYQTFANDVDEAEDVTCGHGTHVAGVLAGSSYSQLHENFGIASSARIAFMDIGKQEASCAGRSGCEVSLETPGEVANLMKAQVATGARIFSFSWGTGANDYNTQTEQVDEYIYNNPEILIVVAAGNSGEKGSHTISSPSGAKNVISVGASLNAAASFVSTPCQAVLNENTVASFSSIGPTLDGRLKPDVVAPGMSIISSQSEPPGSKVKSSAVCPLQGTSQATPVIAGMAVLIYEWLRDGWWKNGVADPTFGMDTIPASLLKALLLHSGEAMARRLVEPGTGVTSCVALKAGAMTLSSYPDFNQGYGKPTMLNLVSFLGHDPVSRPSSSSPSSSSSSSAASAASTSSNSIYFFPNSSTGSEPSVTEGSEVTFHFMLTASVNLRVTLVWTDPPGSVGSKVTLQNDLDLTLKVANTSALFYPLSGNGSRDAVNNVEMVEVSYDDVLAAVTHAGLTVANGYIYVQAVVSGYSVKAGANATTVGQKFSIVASSTPSSTSVTVADLGAAAFWQPWMVIGAIILCTLVVLLLIAMAWRLHVTRKVEGTLKARHGAPFSTTVARPGGTAAMLRKPELSRREQKLWANEEGVRTGSDSCPKYCSVDAGGTRRPAKEEERNGGGHCTGSRRAGADPSAAMVRDPSRRAAAIAIATATATTGAWLEPPRPMSAGNATFQGAIHLEPPVVPSRRIPTRRKEEQVERGNEEKEASSNRMESRRDRGRSARKNVPVKTSSSSSSRRNRLPP